MKQSGFDSFGDNPDYEGLQVLVASIEHQARLNTIGRLTCQKMFTGFVSNRLQLEDWFTNHPDELPVADAVPYRSVYDHKSP